MQVGRILLSIGLVMGLSGVAFGQTPSAPEIAPGGKLRVGMIAITVLGGVAERSLIEGLERGTFEAIVIGVCLAVALRLSTGDAARGRAPRS